uniref:zinc finger and BTB domain-containing protein 22-like isoform X1 n=1 Tax=Styela clava TaxID=7725 RepID=UPI00193954D4|nr:zinc finger and BTB domain-containing protein 22-like isoform X1 [Styela clava]
MTAVDHEHAARLVTHLSQQRASGKYCDVCVCVVEQRFLAHKCVLSANSDQLDALILDATDEDNTSHDIEIEIHGVSPVGFEIVLEYFYTGVLRLEPTTVTNTWMTAVYLGLPDIINRCNAYCQQTLTVTAHPKASAVPASESEDMAIANPTDVNSNGNIIVLQDVPAAPSSIQAPGNLVAAQLSTSTIISTTNTQPKVNSIVKSNPKEAIIQGSGDNTGKGTVVPAPKPFEIRENPGNASTKTINARNSSKKAKLMTGDDTAVVAWNPYGQQQISTSGQTSVTLPVSSVPQVVVNLVQGYGAYQPVDPNLWNSSQQQWAQVQVGKGPFVTTGVIPIASHVKPEPTPATAVQLGAESTNTTDNGGGGSGGARSNSPMSYTTLSLVSQDPPQSDTRVEVDTTPVETPTPAQVETSGVNTQTNQALTVFVPSRTPVNNQRHQPVIPTELNLDNIHFTQISTDDAQQRLTSAPVTSTPTNFPQHVAVMNNLTMSNSSGDDGTRCDTGTIMMQSEVEQLRIQHQQLQRLQQMESENGVPVTPAENIVQADAVKAILATSKRKRKAPSRVSKSEDGTGNTHELHAHSNVRKSRSLAETVLVTITPEHLEYLYQKYPEIKKEPPVSGSCDVMQLLQHGKARQRKSSEQNALNNTIRTILDSTGIVESGDARVQDAVCLIMDRFTVLQDHMNDSYIRKQLSIKVKHSIHCKKWRLKRHKLKQQMEISSSSSPDTHTSWMTDPNNTSNISIDPNNSLSLDTTSSLLEDSLHS